MESSLPPRDATHRFGCGIPKPAQGSACSKATLKPSGVFAFSHDGRLLASRSVRRHRATLEARHLGNRCDIARAHNCSTSILSPGSLLIPELAATLGENDTMIRVWDLDVRPPAQRALLRPIHFATAKIVLVGDSGVGKTGLGWRLTHGEFKEHASTHGEQFWACWIRSNISGRTVPNARRYCGTWPVTRLSSDPWARPRRRLPALVHSTPPTGTSRYTAWITG